MLGVSWTPPCVPLPWADSQLCPSAVPDIIVTIMVLLSSVGPSSKSLNLKGVLRPLNMPLVSEERVELGSLEFAILYSNKHRGKKILIHTCVSSGQIPRSVSSG